MNVVGCKQVYRIKCNPDGTTSRYKTRLVAKGLLQQPEIDFVDNFNPMVKHTTMCVILALTKAYNWPLYQLDVKYAFLHGDLREDVYMAQPLGYNDSTKPSSVFQMVKPIYGLRQAPRACYEKFSSKLPDLRFTILSSDSSLFICTAGSTMTYLLIYVDDIIITRSSPTFITNLI